MAQDYVAQEPGPTDRRQRRLKLTPRGEALERKLTEGQRRRLGGAFALAGPDAVASFRKVLEAVMDDSAARPICDPPSPVGAHPRAVTRQ
jgi:DNA-binding MarR family transcriptional regulator